MFTTFHVYLYYRKLDIQLMSPRNFYNTSELITSHVGFIESQYLASG